MFLKFKSHLKLFSYKAVLFEMYEIEKNNNSDKILQGLVTEFN